MSSSSSSSGAKKNKQQDEANLKILRELAALLPNKQCFDCHQRGPTYVNMTIGSFVCTSCSGILRGLNPPHRVKSISMAIFTSDEIELLKSRGNEYCRRVWLGKYDRGGRSPLEDSVAKDETQMKDYLVLKYEKKRWYLNPSEAFANNPPPVQQLPSSSQNNVAAPNATAVLQQNTSRSHSVGAVTAPPPIQNHPPPNRPSSQQPQPSQDQDLFFRNPAPPVASVAAPSSNSDILFDPFGVNTGFGSSVSSPSGSVHQQPNAASSNGFQGLQPFGATLDGITVPKSATVPSGFVMPSGTTQLQPITAQQQQQHHHQVQQQKQLAAAAGGDKYSALAELDDLFRSSSPVDANLGAEKKHSHPVTTGALGAFPPSSMPPTNNFYQPRPPVSSAVQGQIAANPFATSSQASGGHFFTGVNPVASSASGGFGFMTPAGGAGNLVPQSQGYRPQQPFAQPQMTPMPAMNPFSAPMTNPRPPTGTASWNPFLN